ncbi:hypothetical protein U5B43_02855 [Campylobacter sp. 9BO]|uniref:hypothetical protein n=1 Tax=Campylobacter sp. 9BO TaxID=3424759 RepID=UPI003D34B547
MLNEFLDKVNEIVFCVGGDKVGLDDSLNKAGLDSFAWLEFWLELDEYYPLNFTQEYINSLDYSKTTFGDIAKKCLARE